MAAECDRVYNRLHQQWKIACPRDWLEACLDWIQEENQGRRLVHKELCDQVFEQWLLADLADIGASCLPTDCNQAKVLLQGSYCLQVNSVVDISSPIYAQIQKVEGTENANAQVSASQFSQTQEPKAGRMLMFEMTDGAQAVRGMEYQPLPGFDVNIEPGTKVLVQGPVLCRRGVLMLSKKSLSTLGGEVESLKEVNSQLAVLRRKLMQQTGDQHPRPVLPREKYKSEAKPSHGTDRPGPKLSNQGPELASHAPVNGSKPSSGNGWMKFQDEDFPDDFDPAQCDLDPAELAGLDDQWDDNDLDDLLMTSGADPTNTQPREKTPNRALPQLGNNLKTEARPALPGATPPVKQEVQDSTYSQPQSRHSQAHRQTVQQGSSLQGQCPGGNLYTGNQVKQEVPRTCTDQGYPQRSLSVSGLGPSTSEADRTGVHTGRAASCSGDPDALLMSEDMDDWTPPRKHLKCEQSEPLKLLKCEQSEPLKQLKCEQSEPLKQLKCEESKKIWDLHSAPYTYLRLLEKVWPVKSKQVIRVKAFVSTLLSRLEHNEGRFWSLKVKINDGTAAVDVSLSDQMLTSLIGFSAQECHMMKEKAKSNKEIRLKIATGLKRCQQSLIQLSCILELEVCPGDTFPTVLRHIPVQESDLKALQDRIARAEHIL